MTILKKESTKAKFESHVYQITFPFGKFSSFFLSSFVVLKSYGLDLLETFVNQKPHRTMKDSSEKRQIKTMA